MHDHQLKASYCIKIQKSKEEHKPERVLTIKGIAIRQRYDGYVDCTAISSLAGKRCDGWKKYIGKDFVDKKSKHGKCPECYKIFRQEQIKKNVRNYRNKM